MEKYFLTSDSEDIIVTNHGKPVAVVTGIDGRDFENIGFRGGGVAGDRHFRTDRLMVGMDGGGRL
ncbi:type II toxin-antitoxin system prevent-host-death family antitoxin [bacterium]|nr:MAG: type II toxin-antitoxin system prevent-host-death family antitoxin [bacterium]